MAVLALALGLVPIALPPPVAAGSAGLTRWVWVDQSTGTAPPAEAGTLMAYDSNSGTFVLFGGWNGSVLNETWEYVPGSHAWTDLRPGGAPPPRADGAFVFDGPDNEFVLFGGWGLLSNGSVFRYNDTWTYSLPQNLWRERPVGPAPSARSDTATGYDPLTSELVLFGGFSGSQYLGDEWVLPLPNGTWQPVSAAGHRPSARSDGRMVYDSVDREFVLFGGNDYSGPNLSFHHLDDTWTLRATDLRWTQLPTLSAPPARDYAFEGFDPQDDQVLLYGGFGAGRSLDDTWSLNVGADCWTPLPLASSPPARYAGGASYDPSLGVLIVTSGLGESGLLNDTWALAQESASPAGAGSLASVVPPLALLAAAIGPVIALLLGGSRSAVRRARNPLPSSPGT